VVVVPKPALRKSAIDDRETDRTPKGRVPLAPALCAAQLGVVEKPAQRPTASSRLRSATVMGGGLQSPRTRADFPIEADCRLGSEAPQTIADCVTAHSQCTAHSSVSCYQSLAPAPGWATATKCRSEPQAPSLPDVPAVSSSDEVRNGRANVALCASPIRCLSRAP
jgi:hypothetical protein